MGGTQSLSDRKVIVQFTVLTFCITKIRTLGGT